MAEADYKDVLRAYFKENSIVESQIRSYNYFIEEGIKNIVMSFDRTNIPDYLLETYDEVNLSIEDVWLGEPVHVEVDGSTTKLTPQTARLRGLTYAAPLYMKVTTLIGTQKDEFEVQIAKMPIMLKSSKCILKSKSEGELIELGEDPFEPGGYFIVNGTEKVVVLLEDLALNKFFIEKNSDQEFNDNINELMSKYELQFALHAIWEKIRQTNEYLTKKAPWKMEDKTKKEKVLEFSLQSLYDACLKLQVFLPSTCEKILNHFEQRPISKIEPLFPKIKNNK
jgi:DNA-directed RNA polymerase beta subunit